MGTDTTGANKTADKNGLAVRGIITSHYMAEEDLPKILANEELIKEVAREKTIDPAVIAAIISRESRGEVQHQPWNRESFLRNEAHKLVNCIKEIKNIYPDCNEKMQLKGGIAAYNVGASRIWSLQNVDEYTTDGDYANDVVARAQWFKTEGGF